MVENVQNIQLDFVRKMQNRVIAKQGDNLTRYLVITCYNDGVLEKLDPDEITPVFNCTLPNGDYYIDPDIVSIQDDGTILLKLTYGILKCSGRVNADVSLYKLDEEEIKTKITTLNFSIIVCENAVDEEEVKKSDDYSELDVLIAKASEKDTLAKSYAVGGTGTREGEDTDNSKYYYDQVKSVDADKIKGYADEATASATNAKVSETNAATSASNAKTSETNSKSYETSVATNAANAKTSETNAKASEDNAKSSETNAKASETNAATSSSNASTYASNAKTSETNASTSASSAKTYADSASASATNASDSEKNAKTYSTSAGTSAKNASDSETNAKTSETNSKTSETNAKTSETNASTSASNASASASNAKTSEENAESYKNAASTSATNASTSATDANNYSVLAKSYTVGGTRTRTGEDSDNSKYYYEQVKSIASGLSGTLLPMGTVTFENLPALKDVTAGWLYNVSDQFTTTSEFKEGAGVIVAAGSNVYKTADGYWDVLSGTAVVGVKGANNSTYSTGNINLSLSDIIVSANDIATTKEIDALFG